MHITNLVDVLSSKGELTSGVLVASRLVKDLEIYGFIPYILDPDDSKLYYLINMSRGIVAVDRVVFPTFMRECSQSQKIEQIVLPIFKKLKCDDVRHRLLLEKLYVHAMMCHDDYRRFRKRTGINLYNLKRLSPQISIDADTKSVYYETESEEILMYKKTSCPADNVSAVSTSFLVVCRFINTVTGEISYALYSPEDLVLLAEQKDGFL